MSGRRFGTWAAMGLTVAMAGCGGGGGPTGSSGNGGGSGGGSGGVGGATCSETRTSPPGAPPSTPSIRADRLTVCFRATSSASIEMTNDSPSATLDIQDATIVGTAGGGSFAKTSDTCQSVRNNTLFPADKCAIAVQAQCGSGRTSATLRVRSNAAGGAYDVALVCEP